MKKSLLLLLLLSGIVSAASFPPATEGSYTTKDFKFVTGESLPELRIHYWTIGKPERDASGTVRNAVLIMHGTGGNGKGFLNENFGGHLFGPGQLLDATKHFIILPDGIGHGGSSKPSDGMHMRFPKYTYDDMVKADYLLVTEGLKVNHLRLVMGTSMGAMHTWVWGETYPDFMDALMPLASNPVEIAGRNWLIRQMLIDAIEKDPEWKNGEYTSTAEIRHALRHLLSFAHDQRPVTDAEEHADARSSHGLDEVLRNACGKLRCQRHDLCLRVIKALQSGTEAGTDQSSVARNQLRGRPGESARAGHFRSPD